MKKITLVVFVLSLFVVIAVSCSKNESPAAASEATNNDAATETSTIYLTETITISITATETKTATATITVTETSTTCPVSYFGDDGVLNNAAAKNFVIAGKFNCPTAAKVTEMMMYTNNTGFDGVIMAAIYSDDSNKPGTFLGQTMETAIPLGGGWATVSFAVPVILAPGDYWLACNSTTDSPGFRTSSGDIYYKEWTYGTFESPTWTGGVHYSYILNIKAIYTCP